MNYKDIHMNNDMLIVNYIELMDELNNSTYSGIPTNEIGFLRNKTNLSVLNLCLPIRKLESSKILTSRIHSANFPSQYLVQ